MPPNRTGKILRRREFRRRYKRPGGLRQSTRAAPAGAPPSPGCFPLHSSRFALQFFAVRWWNIVDGRLPAELQSSNIGNDRPTVARRNPVAVRVHHAKPVCDDTEKVSSGRGAQAVHVQRWRATESALYDHAVAVAGQAVARLTVNIEALPSAVQIFARDWERKRVRQRAIHLSRVQK